MLRFVLPFCIGLLFAGSQFALHAQDMVEHALGTGRAATTTAPAKGLGKSVSGLGSALDGLLKSGHGVAAASPVSASSETEHRTVVIESEAPAKPAPTFEDAIHIEQGMTYEDMLRHFGPPSLQITDEQGASWLDYASKSGSVRVELQDGKVSSVELPKS